MRLAVPRGVPAPNHYSDLDWLHSGFPSRRANGLAGMLATEVGL